MGNKEDKELEKLNKTNLLKGLGMRARAKFLEEEAGVLKKNANKLIEAAATMLGLKTFSKEGVGTVTVKQGTNKSLNREKLIEALLNRKVHYKKVTEAIEEATNTTTYTTVEYKKTVPKTE